MSESSVEGVADSLEPVRRRYLTGLFTSSLGGGMVSIVSSFLIYHQTHKASAVALIIVCSNLPALVLAPIATKLAQRWGGSRLYVYVWGPFYLFQLIPFVLGLLGYLNAVTLLAWYLFQGFVSGLGTPSSGLVRTELSPPDKASEFNGAATRATAMATMIGILVGGAALTLVGPSWIYFFAFVAGVPLVLAVVPLMKAPIATVSGSKGLAEFREVRRKTPEIRAAFRFALIIFVLSGYAVTLPALASTIGKKPIILSLLQAAGVFGGLFVVVSVRYIHRRTTWLKVQRACVAIVGVAIVYLGWVAFQSHPPYWYLITAVIAIIPLGFGLNLDSAILNAAVQVAAPAEARSSVLTAYALIPMIALPVSEVLIGGVADLTSDALALFVVGGITVLLVVLPRHASVRVAFTGIDDEHVFPESDLDSTFTIEQIEDAGQTIADQVLGPEIPNREEAER